MIEASSKRPAFRNPLLQEEFNEKGYVVVDISDRCELEHLLDTYHQLYPYEQEGCTFSCHDSNAARRFYAQSLIRNVIETKALSFLYEYQFVSASFVAKNPGEKSLVEPHTDLTFVDHQVYSAIAVWCPLTVLSSDTGRLHVLPGSHLYTPMSGSYLFRSYSHIPISQMTELNPKIGQAVCYDVQTIHGSPANKSGKPRIAANSVFTPIDAQLLHITQKNGRIYRYAVDIDFYASRSSDENANQALLAKYPALDSQPSGSHHDHLASHGSSPKRRNAFQWLMNRSSRFINQ